MKRLALLVLCALAAGAPRDEALTPSQLDALLETRWRAEGIRPAPLVDDAPFLRRVTVDLAGRIPDADGVRAFLQDPSRDKRARKVEELLASDDFAAAWAHRWMRVVAGTPTPDTAGYAPDMEKWLADAFRSDLPYDELARQVIAAEGLLEENGATYFYLRYPDPAQLTAATGLSFLGVPLRCAQCHDHPFAPWTRDQFWGMASLYARVRVEYAGEQAREDGSTVSRWEISERRWGDVSLPDNQRPMVLPPTFLDGAALDDRAHRRQALATWITAPENPYFARAAVNHVWSILTGRGFFDPARGVTGQTEIAREDVLDRLAAHFVSSGYDVKGLIRLIASTRTYQRQASDDPPAPFAAAVRRPLDPWELFRAVEAGTDMRFPDYDDGQTHTSGQAVRDGYRYEFEANAAPLQRLLLRAQGSFPRDAVNSGYWWARLEPLAGPLDRIETLFLMTLNRLPSGPEQAEVYRLVLASGEENYDGYVDALWVLVSTSEFAQRP